MSLYTGVYVCVHSCVHVCVMLIATEYIAKVGPL